MRAIGGQYEYSNSAEYQIGRHRTLCAAGRADAVGAGQSSFALADASTRPGMRSTACREGEQPSAAATESLSAGDTPIDDAIGTAPSLPDQEPSISAPSLPPAPKLRLRGIPSTSRRPHSSPLGSIIILQLRRDVVCASIRKSCRRRRPARGPTSSLPC